MGTITLSPPELSTPGTTDFLRSAVLSVLAPWEARPGPEATFRFAVRQESDDLYLLHEEVSSDNEPLVLAHFALRNGKIWLLGNETETDFGEALTRQGVPPAQIVPGFLPPAVRPHTGYASE